MQPTKRARGKPHSHFPGESRDPGTTEHWLATRRTSSRHGLRGTERAVFSRAPGHRAGRRPAALRSVLWQRHHYGSWAPAFAGETKGAARRRIIFVFPANAGTQGPPSSGWQPEGHQAAMASVARRVLFFQERLGIVLAEGPLR